MIGSEPYMPILRWTCLYVYVGISFTLIIAIHQFINEYCIKLKPRLLVLNLDCAGTLVDF